MVSLIKQDSWDANKKRGTFSKNRGVPDREVKFKLNEVEVSGIVDCINSVANHPMAYDPDRVKKSVRAFSAYHQSENQVVKINFGEYIFKEEVKGFSFSVNKELRDDSTTKGSFVVGFSFSEGEFLKRFLLTYLDRWFNEKINVSIEKSQSYQKAQPEVSAPDRSVKQAEDLDEW